MYLKSLELQGFKSFANRTVLEFKPGITAVIGPNGSGKSNISDAIRWVLGEQSMKSLRGAKSEDIIFAGTQNRKSLGFAEASILLDNSDGTLPIEYNEVTVTRRLYRTGETGYFINKVPCRLKDITELFMDTGIGKDGYSIIGQGRIDEILSNKSEDRRHIFEEAAGIVKYRVRKAETEKKLEQTKINLVRINDIITEIEANLEPLKLQAEKAKKYLELRDELKSIEVGLYLYKIDNFKEKIEELLKDKEIFEEQNKSENIKLDETQKLKEQIKNELEEINEQLERIQNLRFESKSQIEKTNSNISISEERISNNNENKNRLENEITDSLRNIEDLEEDKNKKKIRLEDLNKNKEKFSKELAEKEKELDGLTKKLSKKQLEIEEKKRKNDELIESIYKIKNEITMIDTNCENYSNREKQENKELSKIISELDEKRTIKNEVNKELNEIKTVFNKTKKSLEEIKTKKEKIDNKTKEYEDRINNLTDEKRLKTTKRNFLIETEREKEGYAKSVKDILIACEKDTELKKGIDGVLADIISTDEKYQTAIEMALGSAMQNIVTESENDAKKLIKYLRTNKLGRASFLPVSTVKGKKVEKLIESDGVIGIASDLVKAEKKYNNIVLNLLGRTVITENIETAIKCAKNNKYSFRIVTLEGDIINSSGAMTGGSVQKRTINILGRKAEIQRLEKELKNIDNKIEKTVIEKDKFISDNEAIIKEISDKTEELKKCEIDYAKINEKATALESEIEKIVANKNKTEELIKTLEEKSKTGIENKKELNEKINKIESETQILQSEIEEFTKLHKDEQDYINNLNDDITNLKISVSSFDESNLSIEEIMKRIDEDILGEKNEIENKKEQIEKLVNNNKELEKTIEELKNNIERIEQEVANSGEISEKLKESRNEKNKQLDKTEQEITKQFETIQSVKEGLVKAEARLTATNQNLTDITNSLWNEYEITPNNAKENYDKPSNIQETQKKVNKIRGEMKELGDVNVASIEEYKKTEERYDTMCEQRLDLETTMTKLRNVIQEMTNTMKKQFKEQFKKIQKNFNEVFVELFGGGKAELILDDEENVLESGISIKVQPTGKKLQNMMLLSGGEKALTAIALLFAILKINPAPFCILDEIEAALDDVNVYRYADYLKKFSQETQFLIITHRKGSMEVANTVYGITMEENGISKLLSINLEK